MLTFLDELNFDSELVIEKREKLHLLEKNISDGQGYWNPATLIGSECFYHGANLAPQLLKLLKRLTEVSLLLGKKFFDGRDFGFPNSSMFALL